MLFYVLVILSLILVAFWLRNNNYWKQKNILQTDNILWKFIFNHCSLAEICKTVYDNHDESVIGTFMGSLPALILKDLDNVQAVFASDFQSFHSRGIRTNESDLLADNILFINDFRRWKLIRQKLSPVFTSAKLKNMLYILDKCARDFVESVEDNPQLRLKPFSALCTYTAASIGASIFGIDTQPKNTMDSPFLDMAWKSTHPSLKQNFVIMIANVFPKLFKLLKLKLFAEHEDFFIGAVKSVLKSRRYDTEQRHDFISICLELQKHGVMQDFVTGFELNPTDELLAAQAFFFFVAGADTTANAIHFTLLELAGHPNILKKLHEEIDDIFKDNTEELTYNDIEKLKYLDMVINEALRKYPPIGVVQRICTKNTVLPTGNVTIEKDTIMVTPVFAIHRDEKYYPNPNVFDPERFSPENVVKIPKYAYLPFGEGNRICIGARFARLQVKTVIAWLLRKFTLEVKVYKYERFEKSSFGIRDPHASYTLLARDI